MVRDDGFAALHDLVDQFHARRSVPELTQERDRYREGLMAVLGASTLQQAHSCAVRALQDGTTPDPAAVAR